MFHHFRRNRRPGTTAHTPHRRPEQPPQPSRAAPAPTPNPTEVYATRYRYLPSTAPGLRLHAERCLAEAADDETQATELLGRAARRRLEADDHFRAAALVELDDLAAAQPQPPTSDPAAAAAQLFNGWQHGAGPGEADTQVLPLDEIAAGGAR